MLNQDEKLFIRGRVSIGDDPVGKLICEDIIPFDAAPRELWIQYTDKEAYLADEKALLDMLRMQEGPDRVMIYLGRERAKKALPANWNVKADGALLEVLGKRLGEGNVKVVEKNLMFQGRQGRR